MVKVNGWKLYDFGGHLGIQLSFQGKDRTEWSDRIVNSVGMDEADMELLCVNGPAFDPYQFVNAILRDSRGIDYRLGTPA